MPKNNALFVGLLLVMLLITQGCAPAPQPTAVPTNTPLLPTATIMQPTATSTITPTPQPPAVLSMCPYPENCPDAVDIYKYVNGEVLAGVENEVSIPADKVVVFRVAWVATDDATLEQNLPYLTYFFEIDGNSYFDPNFMARGQVRNKNNPTVLNSSQSYGVQASGWKIGEVHRVRIGITVNETINDGFSDTLAGTTIEYIYLITPQ